MDKENEYVVFFLEKDIHQLRLNHNFKAVIADFVWYSFREQIKFPAILYKQKLDIVHFPHFNVPILYRGEYVLTIHDLTHLDFKMSRASVHNRLYYEIKHQTYKKVFSESLKKSEKIITVSNFVKEQIINRYNIVPAKIAVTYEAVDSIFSSSVKMEKPIIKSPYIFYVGNAHPHKNVEGLIKAFRKLKLEYKNLQLVFSGKEDFFWERVKKEFSDKDIIYKGFVTDKELRNLYENAKAFVFPSFSEGFGIPLLEAFALGCPVISSNKTALPEIGGNAALYFDPYDVNDIANKILHVLNNVSLRKSLIEKGKKRIKLFSWKKMAEETLEVYKECA